MNENLFFPRVFDVTRLFRGQELASEAQLVSIPQAEVRPQKAKDKRCEVKEVLVPGASTSSSRRSQEAFFFQNSVGDGLLACWSGQYVRFAMF